MSTTENHSRRAAQRGFTLIELLIVISILGVLAAVLLPRVLETRDVANETATEGVMIELENAIKRFNRNGNGHFPTDNLRYFQKDRKVKWKKDNGINTGIESLVCMLSQSNKDGTDLGALTMMNTDGDVHGADIPLLGRRDRPEIVDGWNTPLVYFSKWGMDQAQRVIAFEGEDAVVVKAKRREDGNYYGQGKYQILSAGKDRTFGTDDDLVWPAN